MADLEQDVWYFAWNENLGVGIPEIDREHQQFIDQINKLSRVLVANHQSAEVRQLMRAILQDWNAHASHEEELLGRWQYPEINEHVLMHKKINEELHDIRGTLETGPVDIDLHQASLHLKATLLVHFIQDDMKYRDYLRTMGVTQDP